jgi:hypothetical protein
VTARIRTDDANNAQVIPEQFDDAPNNEVMRIEVTPEKLLAQLHARGSRLEILAASEGFGDIYSPFCNSRG